MLGPQKLPEARLQPKDGADRLAILKGQARVGVRTAGVIAGIGIRTIAIVACAGVGLWALGSTRTRSPELDRLDRQMESLRRMDDSLRAIPKIDWDNYYKSIDTLERNRQLDLTRERLDEQLRRAGDTHFDWSLPKPSTTPAVSSQPPSAQQRATAP